MTTAVLLDLELRPRPPTLLELELCPRPPLAADLLPAVFPDHLCELPLPLTLLNFARCSLLLLVPPDARVELAPLSLHQFMLLPLLRMWLRWGSTPASYVACEWGE